MLYNPMGMACLGEELAAYLVLMSRTITMSGSNQYRILIRPVTQLALLS